MGEDEKKLLVFQAALAGLLHDVGKFAQRGAERGSLEGKDAAQMYGRYHAMLTADFLKDVLPFGDDVRLAAANHHVPQSHLDWAVKAADVLSAGERADPPEGDDDRAAQPRQLLSIFSVIQADDVSWKNEKAHWHFFPLEKLALQGGTVFPGAALPDAQVWGIYERMWRDFEKEAEALEPITDLETYLEAMLALLQRYGWCMPSAYYNARPDVSLYDHSRMTAALAACLVELPEDDLRHIAQNAETDETEVALLVGGDISGVQDFIYTISSKGAAKMLRGRSFYLQLLTEAVLRFVLRRLGLPYTSVIYSGGGHFYLLAPLSAGEKLGEIQAEVGKIFYQQHGTQLYLVLGQAAVPANGFRAGKLQEHWQKMHDELTRAKNRRYAELGEGLYPLVFDVPEYGGNPNETCSVCGDDSRGAEEWDEWEGQSKICPLCRSFAETIGKDLPEARFLALKFSEPAASGNKADTALEILQRFGMEVQFLKQAGEQVRVETGQRVVLWALDDPNKGQWPQTSHPTPRWLRYTANRVPTMTFDELQKKVESDFRRLGVLIMDVDNLGPLFKDGLGDSFSLSRMAALSSQISLFFEGWLKRIVEDEAWRNLVYTVYSGGDDLFLIAPWDKTPALAQRIVDDFAAYTAHPGMHISGGMAFIDGKYPIYQAAEDAAEAEHLAKGNGRNSFAFLSRAWKWTEFRSLAEHKNELTHLLKGEAQDERGGPKSILQTLRTLAKMEAEAIAEKGRPVWGRWLWMGAYHLKRLEERQKNNPALQERIAGLREKLGLFQNLEMWGAAARWAQLETRKKKDE
jgi:CRISPR-associated protein Csm1